MACHSKMFYPGKMLIQIKKLSSTYKVAKYYWFCKPGKPELQLQFLSIGLFVSSKLKCKQHMYPPLNKTSREVANLEWKKIHMPTYMVSKSLSLCLSVTMMCKCFFFKCCYFWSFYISPEISYIFPLMHGKKLEFFISPESRARQRATQLGCAKCRGTSPCQWS